MAKATVYKNILSDWIISPIKISSLATNGVLISGKSIVSIEDTSIETNVLQNGLNFVSGYDIFNNDLTSLQLDLKPSGLNKWVHKSNSIYSLYGKNLKIKWVPVVVTYFVGRKSRVVKSIFNYVNNSSRIILKAVRDVRPMKFFGIPALIIILVSLGFFGYFAYSYFQDFKISPYRNYLLVAITLLMVGLQFLVFALIADMIRNNRKLEEELMYQWKKDKYKK